MVFNDVGQREILFGISPGMVSHFGSQLRIVDQDSQFFSNGPCIFYGDDKSVVAIDDGIFTSDGVRCNNGTSYCICFDQEFRQSFSIIRRKYGYVGRFQDLLHVRTMPLVYDVPAVASSVEFLFGNGVRVRFDVSAYQDLTFVLIFGTKDFCGVDQI